MFTTPGPGVFTAPATGDWTAHPPILSRVALAYVSGRHYLGAMALETRPAELADFALVQEIVDASQLTLNPREKRLGASEAKELIQGYVDPGLPYFTRDSAEQDWQSFITINPDASRRRTYLTIYHRPSTTAIEENLDFALGLVRADYSEYQLWIEVNSLDLRSKSSYESRGFELLRRYWTMEMPLNEQLASTSSPELTGDLNIREVDLSDNAQVRRYWELNQDSFSRHFGFAPRDFDNWSQLVLRDAKELKMRVWVLAVAGREVGYIDCDASLEHEQAGFVSGLGVIQSEHGKGYGEILLRHAIAENATAGMRTLLLNVDAGNESGALRLYQKVGMAPISEWHVHQRSDWSRIAAR